MAESSPRLSTLSTARGLLREIRPWQWYKQGVMFLGIIFSQNLLNITAWVDLLVGVAGFTAVAGATYIFNDIADLEEDRNHPTKQYRPIASGQVSVLVAAIFAVILALGGFGAGLYLGPLFVGILVVYIGQNALYSVSLKDIAHVDVIIVAIGFVLRAIGGVVAIDVFLSPWLIVCTFLLALVLALGKRRHELETSEASDGTRESLGEYTSQTVDQLLVLVMATLLMAYALYTFSRADTTMMLTLPFAVFGIFRYHHLVHTADVAGQPEYLLTDVPTLLNLVLWGIIATSVVYGIPEAILGGF